MRSDITPAADRVIILASLGQAGPMAAEVLARADNTSVICADVASLGAELSTGAGALLVTGQALSRGARRVRCRTRATTACSDIPIRPFVPVLV